MCVWRFLTLNAIILSAMAMGPPPSGGGGGGSSCTETDTATNACGNDGSDYSYTETLDADLRTITTSHCPNHKWISLNPNYPYIGSRTYKIPIRPNLMDSRGILGKQLSMSFTQ